MIGMKYQSESAAVDDVFAHTRLVPLSEAVEVNPKIDRSALHDDLDVSFVPMAAVEALSGGIDVSTVRKYAEVKKGYTHFRDGDILFAKVTPCMENGKMAIARKLVNGVGFGSTEFHVLRPRAGVDARYIYYFVSSQTFRKEASVHMTGAVGLRRVPSAYLEEQRIPLPGIEQQLKIVAEIEKQFSRLDEAVVSLQRVKANLKRYKASVLKDAVEGRLVPLEVELARREGRSFESGERLLEKTREQRRMTAKGKRRELLEADVGALTNAPDGWVWATCDAAIDAIDAGASFKCVEQPPRDGEIGVLKVSAVSWGTYNEEESKTCIDVNRIEKNYMVNPGDFLFSRANTIELIGACVIVGTVHKQLMLSDKTLRFKVSDCVLSNWLLICLRTKFGRSEIENLSTGNQESMRNIGQERIRQIRMPLPPLREQERIFVEVARRLSLVQRVEAEVHGSLVRAKNLRQAVLMKCFSY